MGYSVIRKQVKDYTRHKCFLSFHHDDLSEVNKFVSTFDEMHDIFIARAIGAGEDLIDSTDTDYVMRQIRERYLTDSTVTIVMIGKCTWGRRFVDWEIASTLRNDSNNKRSGLMAITLPSQIIGDKLRPDRFNDNWASDDSKYARWWKYPQTPEALAGFIDDAFNARTSRADLVVNNRPLRQRNASC